MRNFIRFGSMLCALLFSTLAVAHQGHGAGMAHEFNHASWLVFSGVLGVVAVIVLTALWVQEEEE